MIHIDDTQIIFNDTHLNKQLGINIINSTTIIMRIVVMNNDNFVAIHPRTVEQYTMKYEIITKIYNDTTGVQ